MAYRLAGVEETRLEEIRRRPRRARGGPYLRAAWRPRPHGDPPSDAVSIEVALKVYADARTDTVAAAAARARSPAWCQYRNHGVTRK